MDIDFLKLKNQENNKDKKISPSVDIDYTKIAQAKKPPVAPAFIQKAPQVIKKVSWWQNIKAKFSRSHAQKNISKTVAPIKPEAKPLIKQSAPAPEQPVSTKNQKVVVAPLILENDNKKNTKTYSSISEKEALKLKKGDMAKNFLGVNLIPSELEAQLNPATKIKNFFIYGIVTLCFILLVYGGMLVYQIILFYQVENMQKQVNNIEAEIISYRPWQRKALLFNDKLNKVIDLFNKHVYWSNVLTFLEKNTLPNVYYTNFTGTIDGTFNLNVTTTDYQTAVDQIALFKQSPQVLSVSVTTISATTNSNNSESNNNQSATVSFNMTLIVNPTIFNNQ